MKVVALATALYACLGIVAQAAESRMPGLGPPVAMAGADPATGQPKAGAGPQPSIIPQITLPPGLMPPVRAPDPRAGGQGAHRFEPPRGRTCFNQAETRDNIASHRLTEPMQALHAGRLQGEALRARLCRWKNDEFVYEISVLRRDGRVVHIYMDARNGQTVGALNDDRR